MRLATLPAVVVALATAGSLTAASPPRHPSEPSQAGDGAEIDRRGLSQSYAQPTQDPNAHAGHGHGYYHSHPHHRKTHHQFHHHHGKRYANQTVETTTVSVGVPGPKSTIIAFELGGQLIPQAEVCQGIEDGTLKWAAGTKNPPACSQDDYDTPTILPTAPAETSAAEDGSATGFASHTPAYPPQPSHNQAQATTSASAQKRISSNEGQDQSPGSSDNQNTAEGQDASDSQSTSNGSSGAGDDSTVPSGIGLGSEFPDGEIDCTVFPSDYGPIEIDWLNLNGWSGIQYPTIENGQVIDIVTGVQGDTCKAGALCSYACPPGYQKSQWPSTQGSQGQSVGGLSCNGNNKLALTNPDFKTLCIEGTGATKVQNQLSSNAALCRTDYPGEHP